MQTVSQFKRVKESVHIADYAADNMKPGRRRNTFVCPNCNSGEGPNKTAAFVIHGEAFKCFSCQIGGDVFDLAGYVEGIDQGDATGKLQAVARWAGIPLEERPLDRDGLPKRRREVLPYRPEAKSDREEAEPEELRRGRELEAVKLAAWAKAMDDSCDGMAYMLSRGFTADEVRAAGIGWDTARRRVTIPYGYGEDTGRYYHIDRDVDGTATHKYEKPRSALVGREPLFHGENLSGNGVCFVVEGQLDALAVEVCGYAAVALGTSSSNGLAAEAERRGFAGTLVLMLDTDETGRRQSPELMGRLRASGAPYAVVEADMGPTGSKDACELFQRDREVLRAFLDGEERSAKAAGFDLYWERMRGLGVADSHATLAKIVKLEGAEDAVPTGVAGLDSLLGGGLRPSNLIALGALSSMGKTTAALQMADSIAARERPVLFVTIEQSAREMIAKSLTRIMRTLGEAGVIPESDIHGPKARAGWGEETAALFTEACGIYQGRIAQWLVFLEDDAGNRIGAPKIASAARMLKARCGVPPVVFVDYLQLLAPADERVVERKNVDLNVRDLRQLARDLETPVVVIASLNRAAYYAPLDLDSFKESGGIEYGADVVMGIQPSGMDDEFAKVAEKGDGQIKRRMAEIIHATKKGVERHLEFKVLKQRGGRPEGTAEVTYLPACNTFFNGRNVPLPGKTSPETRYN